MSRPPQFDVSLDLLERPSSLEDYTAGDASVIRAIEIRQHALMSGWGTPAHVVTFNEIERTYSTVATRMFLVRIPPYCKRMRVAALLWGSLQLTLQTGALVETTPFGSNGLEPQSASWDEGSTLNPSPGSPTACLQVLSAVSDTWSTAAVTIRFKRGRGQLLALALYPVLDPAA
jgi:hypothetical protein